MLDGGGRQPPLSLANGVPEILVSTTPAELVVFRGQPDYQPVGATSLLWANNTRSYVIVDSATSQTYVLLAGRWYRAAGLGGPWSFVPSTQLPADFARIPPDSPAGVVLASVAGTPQAREALIENSLPQTATVPLQGGPSFSAVVDRAARATICALLVAWPLAWLPEYLARLLWQRPPSPSSELFCAISKHS